VAGPSAHYGVSRSHRRWGIPVPTRALTLRRGLAGLSVLFGSGQPLEHDTGKHAACNLLAPVRWGGRRRVVRLGIGVAVRIPTRAGGKAPPLCGHWSTRVASAPWKRRTVVVGRAVVTTKVVKDTTIEIVIGWRLVFRQGW
jgi:hypothetical protein